MSRRAHLGALAGVLLIALAARVVPLREPIRYDEAYSFLTYAVRPVGGIVDFYNLPNNHILNSVLMHEAVQVFGDHLWSLRLPSWICGVLLVPAGYAAGRQLYGEHAGLWAAALFASSATLVDFAVIARGYSPGLLFLVVALWMAALAVEEPPRWWPWPVFAVAGALSVWSVPTMGPGLAAVGLWAASALALRQRWATFGRLIGASLACGLIAYLLYRPTIGQPGWEAGKEVARDWASLRGLAEATWRNWNRAVPWPVEVLFAAAFAAGLAAQRRLGRQPVPIAAAAVVVPALSLATGLGIGRFPRYWMAYLPFFLLTAAAGCALAMDALAARRPGAGRFAAAAPVAVAAVLAALVLAAGQAGAEEPPTGDNGIGAYLVRNLHAGEIGADARTFAPAVDYSLLRQGAPFTTGSVTVPMRQTGRAIVVAPGHDPAGAASAFRAMGGVPGAVHLLRAFHYLSVWQVQVLG